MEAKVRLAMIGGSALLLLGFGGETGAEMAGSGPDLRCGSALCRSDVAMKQLSAGYFACARAAGGAPVGLLTCIRREQVVQNQALARVHRAGEAVFAGGEGASAAAFARSRRLFPQARDRVCRAVSREWSGDRQRLLFEQCVLFRTADRVAWLRFHVRGGDQG
jgi:hypothetical protein